jgi:hypothetical protein
MALNHKLGRCGVYCGQCRSYTKEISETANLLKKYIKQDFSWLKDTKQSFDYENFLKGLDWFKKSTCPGCRDATESWCEVKKCTKIQEKSVDNCLLCEEFNECQYTDYQRNRYSYLYDHIKYIEKEGFEKFLLEEEKRAKEGTRIQEIRDY